jgi:hypothetical protein
LRLEIGDATGVKDGTADLVAVDDRKGKAILIDFKFGKHAVPNAEDNPQMWAYALGVLHAFPNVTQVTLYILQPKLDCVDSTVFKRDTAGPMAERLRRIVERVNAPDPETNPSSLCAFCAKLGSCPAVLSKALSVASMLVEDRLPVPTSKTPTTPEQFAICMDITTILSKWCDSVRKEALRQRTEEGVEIPGYDLAFRKYARKCEDIMGAYLAVKDTLTPEEFISCCKVEIGSLEDTWGAKLPTGQKAKGKAAFAERMAAEGIFSGQGEYCYLRKQKSEAVE